MTKALDELVDNAIHICKKYEEVSPALFQRTLMTDFNTGKKVFEELIKLGVVYDIRENILDDDIENPLGTVDKAKLKEFFVN